MMLKYAIINEAGQVLFETGPFDSLEGAADAIVAVGQSVREVMDDVDIESDNPEAE